MTSVYAYYDGKSYVTQSNIAIKENQRVIITVLDDFIQRRSKRSLSEIKKYMNRDTKSVPEGISTVEYIRKLREE